jgi:hypothetical protein
MRVAFAGCDETPRRVARRFIAESSQANLGSAVGNHVATQRQGTGINTPPYISPFPTHLSFAHTYYNRVTIKSQFPYRGKRNYNLYGQHVFARNLAFALSCKRCRTKQYPSNSMPPSWTQNTVVVYAGNTDYAISPPLEQ